MRNKKRKKREEFNGKVIKYYKKKAIQKINNRNNETVETKWEREKKLKETKKENTLTQNW